MNADHSRVRSCIIAALLVLATTLASADGNDGINLTLETGVIPGELNLQWQGATGLVRIYRDENADGVQMLTNEIGVATTSEFSDNPPAGDIFYYVVSMISAADCSDYYPLGPGVNVIDWSDTVQDYFFENPSCTAGSLAGPDVVAEFTAGVNGFVDISMEKPASARQVMVVSDNTCGTLIELACYSDFSNVTLGGTFNVVSGSSYWFYVIDTDSGAATLPDPIVLTLNEYDCATFNVTAFNEMPPDGSTTNHLRPDFSVEFDQPVSTTAGLIMVDGDLTDLIYDLSNAPPEITFSNGNTAMSITAGGDFVAGETINVGWLGLQGTQCGNSVPSPPWAVQIPVPSCTPGSGGMVGTTTTRFATAVPMTEYYVTPDPDVAGWVYWGGTSALFRRNKISGAIEDIETAAGLTTSQLGYDLLISGLDIFSLESRSGVTGGLLWRISNDGGASWNVEDFAQFPSIPGDDFRGVASHNGRIYMITHEGTLGASTEIWSVDAGATILPDTAVLEGTFADQDTCSGLALDDLFFYTACATSASEEYLLRIDRNTFAVEILADFLNVSPTKNAVIAHDDNTDGVADFLYVQTALEEATYVCAPAGAAFVNVHFQFGTGTSNYGLGYDALSNALWTYDDDVDELVRVD